MKEEGDDEGWCEVPRASFYIALSTRFFPSQDADI
jgi:hypothetical protein